ncbi:alpha/beta hydrolase [Streptomyces sp. NPDC049577]|uniref:alpha/beta hydrolase n=1 Tax=Streptomyces sp. NPDC049577 TaxID=3155153 RepID=UPI00342722A0
MPVRLDVQYQLATTPAGKAVDIYRPAPRAAAPLPTVVLWHGIGPDERDVLEPLARAVAGLGLLVMVPDWRSDAPDGGRAHLLDSLAFARAAAAEHGGDGERIVLAGWSAGAPAALGVALHPEVAGGLRPAAVVGISSRYDRPARTTGVPPLDELTTDGAKAFRPVPVRLVHGTADDLMDATSSRELIGVLTGLGWSVSLEEVPADHTGTIMAAFDPESGRCRPSEDAAVLSVGAVTARTIAGAAGVSPV